MKAEFNGKPTGTWMEKLPMKWPEIRKTHPDTWLVIEALQAHSTPESLRSLDKIAVIEHCSDGATALQSYRRLHQQYPEREFYYVHTSRETLDIHEQQWLGVRRGHAAATPR
jgi:hypothetical protein